MPALRYDIVDAHSYVDMGHKLSNVIISVA